MFFQYIAINRSIYQKGLTSINVLTKVKFGKRHNRQTGMGLPSVFLNFFQVDEFDHAKF